MPKFNFLHLDRFDDLENATVLETLKNVERSHFLVQIDADEVVTRLAQFWSNLDFEHRIMQNGF